MKPLMIKLPFRGLANLCLLAVVACMAVVLATGCHKSGTGQQSGSASQQGIVPTDPVVVSNLAVLTHELRKTMRVSRLTGDFNQFVTASGVEVPPPPAGQKYAINGQLRVILVDANAK